MAAPPSPPSHEEQVKDATKLYYATDSPDQYILLYPSTSPEKTNTTNITIFIHGGFWKSKYGLSPPSSSACHTIIPSLRSLSTYTALFEYRREAIAEQQQWGYPYTNEDIVKAYNFLLTYLKQKPKKIIVIGHSAGGTLALWLLSQCEIVKQKPHHVFALAPVSNLKLSASLNLSDDGDAVQNYMHGQPSLTYDKACPTALAPCIASAAVDITFMLGDSDVDIPLPVVSTCYDAIIEHKIDASTISFVRSEDTDHYSIINASSDAWNLVTTHIQSIFSTPTSVIRS